MSNFSLMPVNDDKANAVRGHMSNTIYQNVEAFIGMYNSGILNRKHEDTIKIVDSITDSFRNVSVIRNEIAIQSPAEIMASDLADLFKGWVGVTRLRREIGDLLAKNTVSEDTVLFLSRRGDVSRVEDNRSHRIGDITRLSSEAINILLGASSVDGFHYDDNTHDDGFTLGDMDDDNSDNIDDTNNEGGEELPQGADTRLIRVVDILGLNDSFISDAYEITR